MENFVVSARKYRPITFDSVVGQSHITVTLKNAIRTNHLAQAFLFCGPRGVGKTTCARILAKTINCQNLSADTESCGRCESCVSFQNNASFNIHELDAASNNSVEDIRNLIDQVRYPPQSGKYKIYIIDEVHMLSQAAFNAFLKTLEEPPAYAIFILATTEKHKILPTILSRCQIFDFNRIQPKDIADHLLDIAQKEGIATEYEALELIAQKADGGLRDALSMFDLNVTFSTDASIRYAQVLDNLHILDYDYYFKTTDALINGSIAQAYLIYDEILRKGFDGHLFVVGLLEHFRNLLVCKDADTVRLLQVSESAKDRYLQQAIEADYSFLLSALSVGATCDLNYKAAKNQRLHVEITLTRLANITAVLNLATLPDGELKKKIVQVSTDSAPPLVAQNTTNETVPTYGNGTAPSTASSAALGAATRPVVSSALKTSLKSTTSLAGPPAAGLPAIVPTANSAAASQAALPANGAAQADVATLPQTAEGWEENTNKPFDFERLGVVWKQFAALRSEAGNSMTEQTILNRDLTLTNNVIEILLDNDLQQETLSNLKAELMVFLRRKLQNSDVQVAHRVAPSEVKRVPYTAQEKFEALAAQNPSLLTLQRALGLDYNY